MLNKIILVGRLTKDPKLVKIGDDEFASFSLAFNHTKDSKGNSLAEFIDCSTGLHLTKAVMENLKSGDKIAVCGRFSNRKWLAKDGTNRTSATIYVDDIEFIDVLKFNEAVPEEEDEEEEVEEPSPAPSPKTEKPTRRTRR